MSTVQEQIDLLAWLHAERDHHLVAAFDTLTSAINLLAWLYEERTYQLQVFVESEERLVRRARAVKALKTQTYIPGALPNGRL